MSIDYSAPLTLASGGSIPLSAWGDVVALWPTAASLPKVQSGGFITLAPGAMSMVDPSGALAEGVSLYGAVPDGLGGAAAPGSAGGIGIAIAIGVALLLGMRR